MFCKSFTIQPLHAKNTQWIWGTVLKNLDHRAVYLTGELVMSKCSAIVKMNFECWKVKFYTKKSLPPNLTDDMFAAI